MRVAAITVVLIAILAVMGLGPGCDSTDSGRFPETCKKALIMIMKMLPESIDNLSVTDLDTWREDENYMEGYRYLQEEYGASSFMDSVQYFGFRDNPNMYIYVGNSEEISQEIPLEQIVRPGFADVIESDVYKGVTVWNDPYSGEPCEAVFENVRIEGSPDEVKACIDVVVDGAPSMYQREGFASVVERLPEGVNLGVYSLEGMTGIIAEGYSLTHDGDQFVMTLVCMMKDGTLIEQVEYQDYF
jgi:hypothetical protein